MARFVQLSLIPAEDQSPGLDLLDSPRTLDAFAGESYAPRANPILARFIESYAGTNGFCVTDSFPGNLVAGKNTHVYDAHTYHTKVPPEAIMHLIEHYTQPGDLVLDPFCGSGMTGVAALKTGRKPILLDLSPAATFIAMNYVTPIAARAYMQAVDDILAAVKDQELALYGTHCRKCGKTVPVEYMVWSYGLRCQFCDQEFVLWDVARDERSDVRESKIKTEFDCPHCGKHLEKRRLQRTQLYPVQVGYWCCQGGPQEAMAIPDDFDRRAIDRGDGAIWYPQAKLPRGVNTRQAIAHGFATVDSLYTSRNLAAVAKLWDVARRWPDKDISAKLMFTVTSLYQRVTRLSEFRFWGGSGNIANYNIPMIFNEQNVFRVFERKAKTIRNYLATWDGHPREPFCISTQSATDLATVPDNTIDYIFTDPPFGDNINYSEMNFLWEAWLDVYTDTTHEAIINRVQGKTIDDYRTLMTRALSEMRRVLKPSHWLTLVFHNSSADVWSALQVALTAGGFRIEQTQTLDKRHGTFKQFVSENAVGYDLIIHCQKTPADASYTHASQAPVSSRASVRAFAQRRLEHDPDSFVVHYLHVKREDELDSRKLFSLWIKERMEAGEVVDLDYQEFREIIRSGCE
jgi:16S rRNA G966 N2-methylase RsmD